MIQDLTTYQAVKNEINNFKFEIIRIKQVNKIVSLLIKTDLVQRPDRELIHAFRSLSIVNFWFFNGFKTGKKEENCVYYEFTFSIKFINFNGIISTKTAGNFLQFTMNNDIKYLDQYVALTLPMIHNLSKYAHITTDKDEKRYLRSIKKCYIKFLYERGFINNMYNQKSDTGDDLILFEIIDNKGNPYSFHLRKVHSDFISYIELLLVTDRVYEKAIINADELDTDFMNYLDILHNTRNLFLFRNAEINV